MDKKEVVRVTPENSIFFNCDIQTKLIQHIYEKESVIDVAQLMIGIAKVFKIPILATEQYPKAFGKTCEDISKDFPVDNFKIFEKSLFSMMIPEAIDFLKSYPDRKNIVLYGIEAHICVQQTCFDLLENGYNVILLTDGISSQKVLDRSTALKRMSQSGARLTTAESVIFELMKDATHPLFKNVLNLVKKQRKMIAHL